MSKQEIIEAVKFATTQTELSNTILRIEFIIGYHKAEKMMDILEKNLPIRRFFYFWKYRIGCTH